MLPIRRITSDFRELRWGQVLVELVLLVVGILIALAVNGWIEDRRDAQTERQYLEGIVRDLDRDLTVLKEFADYHQSQVADGVMAYRALRTEPDVKDKEGVARAVTRLMSRRTLRLSHPTYSNLVGTGNARLIRNVELRDRIVGLYEANERWSVIIDRNNLVFVDQMFAQYMMDNGLVAPRPTSNLPSCQKEDETIQRTGGGSGGRAERQALDTGAGLTGARGPGQQGLVPVPGQLGCLDPGKRRRPGCHRRPRGDRRRTGAPLAGRPALGPGELSRHRACRSAQSIASAANLATLGAA